MVGVEVPCKDCSFWKVVMLELSLDSVGKFTVVSWGLVGNVKDIYGVNGSC
jgi:hypothetical protein